MGKQAIVVSKQKAIVLDSWAAVAFLEDEAAAAAVGAIMEQAHDAGVPLLMTVINAGEIWYGVARSRSVKRGR